jgi:Uma2 family endonuclease
LVAGTIDRDDVTHDTCALQAFRVDLTRMSLPARVKDQGVPVRPPDTDQRVMMHGVDWWQFETLLAVRGDRPGVRMTYLEGELELMSPSRSHENVKKYFARLLEAYAEEKGLVLEGYGSMTLRNPPGRRGIEPDECYALGASKDSPDLAIEVVWTRGGIDKLEVYRGLGVREVWIWDEGKLSLHALRGDRYEAIARSELLPELDPALLVRLLACETQSEAVRTLRTLLRGT